VTARVVLVLNTFALL